MSEEHKRFTAEGTAYMRNVSRAEMNGHKWAAVLHQEPPVLHEDGRKTISMRFPLLIVAHYIEGDQLEIAAKVARILNAHWETDGVEAAAAIFEARAESCRKHAEASFYPTAMAEYRAKEAAFREAADVVRALLT